MRLSLAGKITSLVLFTVLVMGVIVSSTTYYVVTKGLNTKSMEEIASKADAVEYTLQNSAKDVKKITFLLSTRPDIADALAAKDTATLRIIAKSAMAAAGLEFITIADPKGIVVARSHSDKTGDSVLSQLNVERALKGEGTVGMEEGSAVKFSLRAGYPVMKDGKIVGSLTAGLDLSSSNTFVDQLKKVFGTECTFFYGDTRVATTIERDGKRAVGTRMDNPVVLDTVLKQGKRFLNVNTIMGKDYTTAYWPILGANGKITGMLFIGQDRSLIEQTTHETLLSILGSSAIAGLLAIIVGLFMTRSVTLPLRRVMSLAAKVAGGDLEATAEGRYTGEMGELKNAIETMVAGLKEKIAEADEKTRAAALSAEESQAAKATAENACRLAETAKAEGILQTAIQLQDVVEILTSASEQLSVQIEQSSRGSGEQSQRVEETATAMEEMNATVLEVAKNASQAAETAQKAKDMATDGARIVSRVVEGIGHVQTQALGMKQDMAILGEQAEGIGKILNVISDIADQTNLLALNAAIEAARAGDAGRGFAVVADEVRKLAEKTMSATREVGEAIRGIQQGTSKNIGNVETAVKTIGEATALASDSGNALTEIVHLVDLASDQVRSIATASEQQSSASEEINRSIDDVSRISGETADAMRQSSAAVNELANQAQILKDMIIAMKNDTGEAGGKPSQHVSSRPRALT